MEERGVYIVPERSELKKVQAVPRLCKTSRLKKSLSDCCPECMALELPHFWAEDSGSFRASYRCHKCGHQWRTWWDRQYILSRARER